MIYIKEGKTDYKDLFVKCRLFQELDESEYQDAYDSLHIIPRPAKKNMVIIREEDRLEYFCILKSGIIRGERFYDDGTKVILRVIEPNDVFSYGGISGKGTAPMDYVCSEDCDIVCISWESIFSSPYSHQLMKALLYKQENEFIRQMRRNEILTKKSLRERIMLYLNFVCKKSASKKIHIPLNQEQLSDYLCVNRSALSNELNKMKKEGLIDFKKHEFQVKY